MKISVLIPTYNEERYILQTLKKVNDQKNKFDLEIIISDDGSTDGTISLLNNNQNLYDKLIDNKNNQGKGKKNYHMKKRMILWKKNVKKKNNRER